MTNKQYDTLCDWVWRRYDALQHFRYGHNWGVWKNVFYSRYRLHEAVWHAHKHVGAIALQYVGPYPNHDKPVQFFVDIVNRELERRQWPEK